MQCLILQVIRQYMAAHLKKQEMNSLRASARIPTYLHIR